MKQIPTLAPKPLMSAPPPLLVPTLTRPTTNPKPMLLTPPTLNIATTAPTLNQTSQPEQKNPQVKIPILSPSSGTSSLIKPTITLLDSDPIPSFSNLSVTDTAQIARPVSFNNQNPNFLVLFDEAYSFRHLINFLSMTSFRGNFTFKPEGIYYEQDIGQNVMATGKYSATQNIQNFVFIQKKKLTTYIVNLSNQGPDCLGYIIGINLVEFQKITQQINRNDKFYVYNLPSAPSNIYTQLCSKQTTGRGQYNVIQPIVIPQINKNIEPEFKKSEEEPNCTVPLSDFSKIFAGFHRQKCDYVCVRCYPKGILFEGYLQGYGNPMSIDSVGVVDDGQELTEDQMKSLTDTSQTDCDNKSSIPSVLIPNPTAHEIITVRISAGIIRSFSRWSAIGSPRDNMEFYAEEGNPHIKLVCPVGGYATLRCYLRDGGDEVGKAQTKRGRKPKA